MQLIISTRGMSVSKTYKDALTGKLAKLEPLLPGLVDAKAMLSKEKHRRTAALTLVAKNHAFHAEETAGDLAAAVDMAVAALVRQVRAHKDRIKDRKARPPRRRPAPPPAQGGPDLSVRRVRLEPMSLEAAVAALGEGGEDVVVFANAATLAVSVLHRRRDGGLALVEPEP